MALRGFGRGIHAPALKITRWMRVTLEPGADSDGQLVHRLVAVLVAVYPETQHRALRERYFNPAARLVPDGRCRRSIRTHEEQVTTKDIDRADRVPSGRSNVDAVLIGEVAGEAQDRARNGQIYVELQIVQRWRSEPSV